MAEDGIEKRAMRTVLGVEDEGISTSDTFDLVVRDHGVKSGLQYDSVCITPVEDPAARDVPGKTVQVLYTQDKKMQGNLKFATVAVCEMPMSVKDESTISKMVHLCSSKSTATESTNSATSGHPGTSTVGESQETFASDREALQSLKLQANFAAGSCEEGGIFASDPEDLKYIQLGPNGETVASSLEEEEGIFASDPEALKFIRFGPKPPKPETTGESCSEDQQGIFASDPEALKFIRLGPKPNSEVPSPEEPEGIFASDPEALKFIRFGPKPPKPDTTGVSSSEDQEGIFASDPEALKFIRFGPKPPKPETTGVSSSEEQEGIFASDPEALKFIRFGSKPLKPETTGALGSEEPNGIFASDPEALRCIRFGPKPITDAPEGVFVSDPEALKRIQLAPNPPEGSGTHADPGQEGAAFASDSEALKFIRLARKPQTERAARDPPTLGNASAEDGEGDLLAEATGVKLQDDRTYSVRVSGHALPDGQQKKFVSVRSSDGAGGPTPEEIDSMRVTVETKVGEDGLVEKFIVVE